MPNEQDRLAKAEMRIGYVEQQFVEVNHNMSRLADDMHQLALASATQAEDREALRRAFANIEKVVHRVEGLEHKIHDQELLRLQEQIAQKDHLLEMRRKDRQQILITLFGAGITMLIAIVGAHFGIKML